ncbi:MAG: S41 family peptidase [Chitinophagaceae bacterium]
MQRKKLDIWTPTLLALVMVGGMFIGYDLRGKAAGDSFFASSRKSTIEEVMSVIESKYVDKVQYDSVSQAVIDEILGKLDPHSSFIPYNKLKEANEELMGNFQGIGIEFQIFDDTIHVLSVVPDGPSFTAGLEQGDKILKANDTILLTKKKLNGDSIRGIFRGEAGTNIKVALLRNGKILEKTITRGNIPVSAIDAAHMLNSKTGYIKINKFGDRTYEEFMQSLEKLQAQKMTQLVLDLRGNGGGLMGEATAIADEFLSGDKLIVYTEGEKSGRFEYRCKKEGLFETGKLVVLIDETSASASEVLSGALQDWDRATIIGRRSFGKGLVQQQFNLSDGSALRLTIARYYTPLGRNIQKDYTHKSKKEYYDAFLEQYENGHLTQQDTIQPATKPFKTPSGRTVYGGGGITPDIFVPMDSTLLSKETARIYSKSTLNKFAYYYGMQHKNNWKNINNATALLEELNKDATIWNQFNAFATKDSAAINGISTAEKQKMKEYLFALIARHQFRSNGYYQILNNYDLTIRKALEFLQ